MYRKKIALIGGGQVGSMVALLVTQKELGNTVIVDLPQYKNQVKGKALDIMALRPHDAYDVNLSGTSDYAEIVGAHVVVVTAGIPRTPQMSRKDLLSVNLKIIKKVATQVKKYTPEAFVVIATNPVDAMTHAFHKFSGFPKQRVIGLSGALDTGRFQSFIAMETGMSVKDVSCLVMGGHGPTMVPIVRTATVGGIPLTDLLSAEKIAALVERTREAGTEIVNLLGTGSAYFSSAASIVEMVEAYILDKKRIIASSVLCEGEYGIKGYFIGVPCIIGAHGVERIIEFKLADDESRLLHKDLESIKETVADAEL